MLRRIAVTIYKRIVELGQSEDSKCRIDRSLFRPVFIFIVLLCQKAAAGVRRLPFHISDLSGRAPPTRFELYGFYEISSYWKEMYE